MTGLCHGPGCRENAKTGPWCSPACEDAWHGQWRWLYGDGDVEEPTLAPVLLTEEEDARGEEEPAVNLERRFAELGLPPAPSCPHTHPDPSVVDEIRAAYIQHTDLPGGGLFRMTRWQGDLCLYDAEDGTVRWRSDDTVLALSAGPIELVDRVEDSTPYRLWCERRFGPGSAWPTRVGATFPQVASEESQVAQSGRRAWFRMRRTR